MKYVIDRFEGIYAILECDNGKDLVILRSKLPIEATEGDVIECINGIYNIDKKATKEINDRLSERMKKFRKN